MKIVIFIISDDHGFYAFPVVHGFVDDMHISSKKKDNLLMADISHKCEELPF